MDSDGLPLVGPGIDYSKVEAINQKRTIAFINHFITHTSRFLNRFSCVCEEKLENMHSRILHLEVSLGLLEAKLSSIPGLENVTISMAVSTTIPTNTTSASTASVTESSVISAERDALPAVKTEMAAAGLNPDLLDTPDAPSAWNKAVQKISDDSNTDTSDNDSFDD